VIQKSDSENEKISMTSPVIIKSDKNQKSWTMSFSMPSKFTLESLPIPNDERVKLEKVDSRFVAALRFTGFWNKDKNEEKASELISWLEKNKKFIINSKPMFAGYNPPWTIPIFRRNEILIELEEININN